MLRKIAGVCGITFPLVGLTVLLVALSGSPSFSWTESELCVLGVESSAATLFNWGLILIGVLNFMFAIGLRRSLPSNRLAQFGGTCLILGSIALSAIGIFPRSIRLPHNLAAIPFVVSTTLALLLIGVALVTASQRTRGLLSLVVGIVASAFMVVPWPWSGGAIPQLVFCVLWSLWTIIFAVGLLVPSSRISIQ